MPPAREGKGPDEVLRVRGDGRDRGEYHSRDEAGDLAAQLPDPLAEAVRRGRREQTGSYGVQDFCRRVAERTGAQPRTAEQDASAVLSTLADAVSGGGLNQLLSQLPSGYATLFGRPGLS